MYKYSGVLRCVDWEMHTDVSEVQAASIYKSQAVELERLTLEGGGTTVLRNVGHQSFSHTASHHRRLASSGAPLWEPRISYDVMFGSNGRDRGECEELRSWNSVPFRQTSDATGCLIRLCHSTFHQWPFVCDPSSQSYRCREHGCFVALSSWICRDILWQQPC
jgi:hypothetical protein